VTPLSLGVTLLALLLSGLLLHIDVVYLGMSSFAGEHAIPFPPIVVLVLITLVVLGVKRLLGVRLLTRAELLCVVYAMLIATPLMTQGFWHRFVSITATLPRERLIFPYLDQYPEQLWPHGVNLLADAFDPGGDPPVQERGDVTLEQLSTEAGSRSAVLLAAAPSADSPAASVRFRVELQQDGDPVAEPGERMLFYVLARPGEAPAYELPAGSRYYVRLYPDGQEPFTELIASSVPGKQTFVRSDGFVLVGVSGVALPRSVRQFVDVEFGLVGPGKVSLVEPRLLSIEALEQLFTGRELVTAQRYAQLDPSERVGLVVRPDNLFSAAGVQYLLSGYVPWSAWVGPIAWWTALFGLLLLAAFAINVLLRKQWIDGERYPLPLTQIPLSLFGVRADQTPGLAVGAATPGPIWRHRMMWAGWAGAFVWCLLRAWSYYNEQVPSLELAVAISPYFDQAVYGKMFVNETFLVTVTFLSIALFMDLSVLMSIVVGLFLYRSLFWLGEVAGWTSLPGYPWSNEQQTGAFLMYAGLILLFMWRYLLRVLRSCVTWDRAAWEGELMPYPAALGLLVGCVGLSVVWAVWLGVPWVGVLTLFLYLLTVSLVATKVRAECGTPFGYLGPNTAILALVLLGGLEVFGSEAFLMGFVVSFFVGGTPFFLIPGAQLELTELGRRMRVRPSHVVTTVALGLVGGMFIGGWVFLSNTYAAGADAMNYQWAYSGKAWYFSEYRSSVNAASLAMDGRGSEASGFAPSTWGYIGGGGALGVVAVLRQMFAGFWLHPLGMLLGSTFMAKITWGSCLTAWVIRVLVVRFGGAVAVKNQLQPMAIGLFLGGLSAHLLIMIHNAWLLSRGVEQVFYWPNWAP